MSKKAERLAKVSAEGLNIEKWNKGVQDVLGWEVFCSVHNKRIHKETFIEEFTKQFGYAPDAGTVRQAFADSVKDVCQKNKYIPKKVVDAGGRQVFVITNPVTDAKEEDVQFDNSKLKIEYNDKDDVLSFNNNGHPIAQEVKNAFEIYRVTVSDDRFRWNFKYAIISNYGKPLRKTGGIYFMPNAGDKDNAGLVEKLKSIFNSFEIGKVYAIKFDNKEDERAVIWESVKDSFEDKVKEIAEVIDDRMRERGIKTLISGLDFEKEGLTMYGKLLQMESEAQKVMESAKEISDKLGNKLTEAVAAKQ